MKKLSWTLGLFSLLAAMVLPARAADNAAASTPATGAAPAAAPASTNTPPAPTLEQRVAGLEAYIGNTDPSSAVASLKDKDGNLPKDFTMATLGTPGPGHNALQMASAALVLFMTLP